MRPAAAQFTARCRGAGDAAPLHFQRFAHFAVFHSHLQRQCPAGAVVRTQRPVGYIGGAHDALLEMRVLAQVRIPLFLENILRE